MKDLEIQLDNALDELRRIRRSLRRPTKKRLKTAIARAEAISAWALEIDDGGDVGSGFNPSGL